MFDFKWLILFSVGLPLIAFCYWRQREQEKLTRRDDLTGLSNRRGLLRELSRELERARRYGRELSVLMIDLDHFKAINDAYGHLAGDRLLKELGSILARSIRRVDCVGRWGGDEFLAILPETAHEEAEHLAWRLGMNVRRQAFRIKKKETVHVSLSMGISSLRDSGKSADMLNLIDRADQEMLDTKYASREKLPVA